MTAPLLRAAISAIVLLQVAIGIGVALWRLRHEEAAPPIEDDVATTAKAWTICNGNTELHKLRVMSPERSRP